MTRANLYRDVVVVGTGHAAYHLATSLRATDWRGSLCLVGIESLLPYQRPPLSKAFLQGSSGIEDLVFKHAEYYASHDIDLLLANGAHRISPGAQELELEDGSVISYGCLVLATGSVPRALPRVQNNGQHVALHTRQDASHLKDSLRRASNILIVGAGFIGLEVASTARDLGVNVDIVEMSNRAMSRLVSEPVSDYFNDLHSARGCQLHFETTIIETTRVSDERQRVLLSDGSRLDVDLLLTGIGAVANDALARNSGLEVDDGIVVDTFLRTSDPNIFAIGDCARIRTGIRMESVQNASDQGRTLAQTISGVPSEFEALPWFWTAQAGSRLQIAGLARASDLAIRDESEGSDKFSVLRFRDDQFVACESVNAFRDHALARRILDADAPVSIDQLRQVDFQLSRV